MAAINDRRRGRWVELLIVPLVTLIVNGAVTYGVVSTQLQWIRADLDRQQRHIERIEHKLMQHKIGNCNLVPAIPEITSTNERRSTPCT